MRFNLQESKLHNIRISNKMIYRRQSDIKRKLQRAIAVTRVTNK